MASPEKRCLYEVLGVSRDCSADEIRSAYKKQALQRHPDKLVQSGVPESEATAAFQELVNAYEVLSDPRERSWYDSNRSKILFSSSTSGRPNSSFGSIPNLFSFFSNSVYSGFSDTGKGFYKVYADVFDKVYHNEVNFANKLGLNPPKEAPLMGNSNSPYAQVTAFYSYWLGFTTVMDFCWVDQYDVMAGINRKSRRVMEDENKKLRKKARREYNETVRGLAEFAKKRDKRVIDMQLKRNEEMEKKREEEQARKKELERLKEERAKKYKEPDWTQVEDVVEDEAEETSEEDDRKEEMDELYCIACGKKFKTEKQWKNHERSKKHKEKVAALREAFSDEDKEFEETDVNGRKEEEEEQKVPEADQSGYFSATDDAIDELGEQFEGSFGIQGKSDDDDEAETSGKNSKEAAGELGSDDDDDEASILEAMVSGHRSRKNAVSNHHSEIENDQDSKGTAGESGSDDDDEASILEAMVSGRKSRKNAVPKHHSEIVNDDNEMDFMEYNNLKSTGRKRGSRKQRNRRAEEEMKFNKDEPSRQAEKSTECDENLDIQRSPKTKTDEKEDDSSEIIDKNVDTQRSPKTKADEKEDNSSEMIDKIPRQVNKKGNTKKDNNTKSKNSSKGRKEKKTSKVSGNACEKCGEEFESRTKLHKHLGETGHASIKTR